MKSCALATLLLAGTAGAQLSFTYETDAVLVASGDFGSADGRRDIVVVHRATGQVSFGRPDINGSIQWSPPEPCGITGVTALAVDKFAGGNVDLAAITGPGANRVTLAGPNSANTQTVFRHIYPNQPGSKALAPFDHDADGNAELLLAGNNLNGTGTPYYYEYRSGLSGASSQLWTVSYGSDTYRFFRYVPKTGATPLVGETFATTFWTERPTAGTITGSFPLSGVTIGPATLMTYGHFDGSAYAQVVLYNPGESTARAAKITEPSAGSFGFAPATTLTFPKAVQQLVTIPTAAGGARLGIVFTVRTAAVYDFDGATLTLRNNLFGTPFDWIVPLGTDSLASKSNLGWQRFNTASTNLNLTPTHAGAYPAVGTRARVSNVVFFSAEPFVNPAAAPVAQGSIRDWSTAVTGTGTSWNVAAAEISAAGIGTPSSSTYASAVSASHALANQYRPNISTRSLENAAGPNVPDVIIQPDSGVYRPGDSFFLTLNPTQAGMDIRYRVNAGSWQTYNFTQPPKISAAATVQAYATTGSAKSPTRSATYTFSAAPALAQGATIDLDGDGMPDAWEKSFNLQDPMADADGDGASNLAEYLSGTDPADSSSTPPSGPLVLRHQKSGNNLRLSWDVTTPATLQSSATLTGAWTDITAGISVEGAEHVYDVPTGGANPPRLFFRLIQP